LLQQAKNLSELKIRVRAFVWDENGSGTNLPRFLGIGAKQLHAD
jgi:hypothetical protein